MFSYNLQSVYYRHVITDVLPLITNVLQTPFNGLFSRTTWVSQHQKY